MKLYWSPRSPFVRKVMVCAHETGTASRIDIVPTLVDMTQPNFALMRDNPLSRIPTLVTDEGEVFHDSLLICEYLDTLHEGPRLFPAGGEARWQALRWHALCNGMLDILVLWRNERLKPAPQRMPELLSAFELKIRRAVETLEHEAPALKAAEYGIGHIAVGCALGYIDFRFAALDWRNGHDAIAAWYRGYAQRPAAQRTAPAES